MEGDINNQKCYHACGGSAGFYEFHFKFKEKNSQNPIN